MQQKQKKTGGNPNTPLPQHDVKPKNALEAPNVDALLSDIGGAIDRERKAQAQKQKDEKARADRAAKEKAKLEQANKRAQRRDYGGCGCW